MTTLTRSNPTSHPPAGPPSRLSLQITRPGTSPRTIPLPVGKCTVGSSQRCHIRLPGEPIQPLHCLIVRSPAETQITRWAPGALLNGREFTSETIQPGDCVTLGDVQLQLVDQAEPIATAQPTATAEPISPIAMESFVPAAPDRAESIAPPPPATTYEPPSVAAPADTSQLEADRLVLRLRSANTNTRQRCRGAIASLRNARDHSMQLGQQIVSLEGLIDALRDESLEKTVQLEQGRAEKIGQDQQSTAEIDRLTEEFDSLAQQLSKREATLENLLKDSRQLQQEIESLQIERKRLTTTAAEQQQLYGELEVTLAERDEQIEEISAELQQSLKLLQALETVQGEQSSHAEQLRDELTALQSQQQQQQAELANSREQQVELEQVLAQRDGQVAQLRTKLAEAQQSLLQLEQSGVDQVGANKLLKEQLTELQTEKSNWLEEESQHRQQQFDLQQELSARDESIHDLTQQLAISHDHFSKLQQQLDNQLNIAQGFETEALELRSQSEQQINEAAAHNQRRVQLEQIVKQQQQSLAALQHEADVSRNELDLSVQHVAQLEQEQVAADQQIADLQAEVNGQSTIATRLQQEKDDLLARRDTLSDQLEQTRQELESTCRELDRSQQECRDQHVHIANRAEEIAEASQEIESLRSDKLALEQSVERKQIEIEEIRTDLDYATKELQNTQQADLAEPIEPDRQGSIPAEQPELFYEQAASDERSAGAFSEEPAVHPSDELGLGGDQVHELDEATEQVESETTSVDYLCEPSTEQPSELFAAEAELEDRSPSTLYADESASCVQLVREESDDQESFGEELADEELTDEESTDEEPTNDASNYKEPCNKVSKIGESYNLESNTEESDEAALEAYMSNLMRRVRGESNSDVPVTPNPVVIEPPSASPEPRFEAEERQPVVPQTHHQSPEPIDLSQLRTLANTSARQAISSHRRRHYLEAAAGKLFAGSIALGTSAYLFANATEFTDAAFYGGSLAAIVGSYWAVQLGVMLMFAGSNGSPRVAGDSSAKTEQLPIDGQAETPSGF